MGQFKDASPLRVTPRNWSRLTSFAVLGLGLILTFVLTLIAAGTMSSMPGHLVGTPVTGARLPIVGWSREVGDLRPAHFFATHALHVVPLAGFAGSRAVVWLAAAAFAAGTMGIFALGLMGRPLI